MKDTTVVGHNHDNLLILKNNNPKTTTKKTVSDLRTADTIIAGYDDDYILT